MGSSRLLLCALVSLVCACSSREPLIEGRVEMRELTIASKYPGRIAKLHIEEGQRVQAGQLIVEISDPEAEAKKVQADAAVTGAAAQQDKADEGARKQELVVAQANVNATRAQAELARVTEERMRNLFAEGVVARQRLDEAEAARRSTESALVAAQAAYSMLAEGVRPQDKITAAAVTEGAVGMREEVQAALVETRLHAPADGLISTIVLRETEIVPAGLPVAILVRDDIPWVSFNLREDLLQGLEIGQRLRARIPALGKDQWVELRVERISVMAEFATWHSTRDLGSYDLRTFEVRAHPVSAIPGLRAGMSVLLSQKELGAR